MENRIKVERRMCMKKNIKNLVIRVVKTMSQAAIGVIGSSALISDVSWTVVLSTVALAGITCILMNLTQLKEEE